MTVSSLETSLVNTSPETEPRGILQRHIEQIVRKIRSSLTTFCSNFKTLTILSSCNKLITSPISILALRSLTVDNLLTSAPFTLVDEEDDIPVESWLVLTFEVVLESLPLPRISELAIDSSSSNDGRSCVSGKAPVKCWRRDCRLGWFFNSSMEVLNVKS